MGSFVIKLSKIIIAAVVIFSPVTASAQPYFLIEQESPYTLKQMEAETVLLLGYETGHIPDFFAGPRLSFGIVDWLQIGGGFSYVYFQQQEEYRISEYEFSIKARVHREPARDFNLYAYARYREATGGLLTVPYEGNDPDVIAVVSPRADQGRDLTGGFAGRFLLHTFMRPSRINNLALMFGANYTRTGNREYYAVSVNSPEGYKNRVSGSITPALFFGQNPRGRGKYPQPALRKNSVMFAVENRFTYWSELGTMYDIVPQINFQPSRSSALFAGVSIPVQRKEVTKFYLGASMRLYFWLCAGIKTGPNQFTPDGDGKDDLLTIYPKVHSRKPVRRWKIVIYDPSGVPFKAFRGKGECPHELRWDGKSYRNETVESAQKYKIKITVWDIDGNEDEGSNTFKTGILFEKSKSGYEVKLILFKTDEETVQKEYRVILDKLAAYLMDRRYRQYHVEIQGHTDDRLGKEYNLRLSERRALNVLTYLAGKGVPRHRLSHRGFGKSRPIASNLTLSGKRKNRRVEFVLTEKKPEKAKYRKPVRRR